MSARVFYALYVCYVCYTCNILCLHRGKYIYINFNYNYVHYRFTMSAKIDPTRMFVLGVKNKFVNCNYICYRLTMSAKVLHIRNVLYKYMICYT